MEQVELLYSLVVEEQRYYSELAPARVCCVVEAEKVISQDSRAAFSLSHQHAETRMLKKEAGTDLNRGAIGLKEDVQLDSNPKA